MSHFWEEKDQFELHVKYALFWTNTNQNQIWPTHFSIDPAN
jgi:hypothetical protein